MQLEDLPSPLCYPLYVNFHLGQVKIMGAIIVRAIVIFQNNFYLNLNGINLPSITPHTPKNKISNKNFINTKFSSLIIKK